MVAGACGSLFFIALTFFIEKKVSAKIKDRGKGFGELGREKKHIVQGSERISALVSVV